MQHEQNNKARKNTDTNSCTLYIKYNVKAEVKVMETETLDHFLFWQ